MSKRTGKIIIDISDIEEKIKYVKDQIESFDSFYHIPCDILDRFSSDVKRFFSNIVELGSGTAPGIGDYIFRFGVGGDFKKLLSTLSALKAYGA